MPKKEKITGKLGKLHDKELCNLHSWAADVWKESEEEWDDQDS
jgi:hypothetical protein